MAKLLKQYLRKEFANYLDGKDGAVLVHYQGMSSEEEYNFRTKLREKAVELRVVKASIARVYCRDEGFTGDIDGVITGPIGVVTTREDEGTIGISRKVIHLLKEQKKVKVQGALFDGEVLPSEDVDALSRMPTREQLLGRLAGAFQGPPRNFASTIYQINARFASVLKSLQSKREDEEN